MKISEIYLSRGFFVYRNEFGMQIFLFARLDEVSLSRVKDINGCFFVRNRFVDIFSIKSFKPMIYLNSFLSICSMSWMNWG